MGVVTSRCLLTLQVNGQPTPDLDTFLSVVSPLKDGDFARVKVCHLETTQQKVRGLTNTPWPSVPASLFDYPCRMTASEHACVRMQSVCIMHSGYVFSVRMYTICLRTLHATSVGLHMVGGLSERLGGWVACAALC